MAHRQSAATPNCGTAPFLRSGGGDVGRRRELGGGNRGVLLRGDGCPTGRAGRKAFIFLFLDGKFRICRVEDTNVAVLGCFRHLPPFWRAELQICEQKEDVEDQKPRSTFLPGARRTPWSEISKTGSKTERNYASTGWLDVCSQPGPHGQKMLGLPHGFSPSGVVDDVGFNPTALTLIILRGFYGVWKFHSTRRRKERWKQYAKNGDTFGKKRAIFNHFGTPEGPVGHESSTRPDFGRFC